MHKHNGNKAHFLCDRVEFHCQSKLLCIPRAFSGFGGKTEMDQVRVDMIIDCTEDILKSFMESRYEKTEEDKVSAIHERLHACVNTHVPPM